MNYDTTDIPAAYDRARTRSPRVMALWLNAIAAHVHDNGPTRLIVDLGCGTGRFTAALSGHFAAHVIGIDPSKKMLQQATPKADGQPIRYVLGRGEQIPLRDGSADLVFMSMVLHHFGDPRQAAAECHRILRPHGHVFLRAGTRERIASYPASRYFPTSVPIMERVLAATDSIIEMFEAARFHTTGCGILEQEIATTHHAYGEQIAAGGDSVLVQLEPAHFNDGLAALRAHAASVDLAPVTEPIDYFAFEKRDV